MIFLWNLFTCSVDPHITHVYQNKFCMIPTVTERTGTSKYFAIPIYIELHPWNAFLLFTGLFIILWNNFCISFIHLWIWHPNSCFLATENWLSRGSFIRGVMISTKPVSFSCLQSAQSKPRQTEAEIEIVHNKFRGILSSPTGGFTGPYGWIVSGELIACSTASFLELLLPGM